MPLPLHQTLHHGKAGIGIEARLTGLKSMYPSSKVVFGFWDGHHLGISKLQPALCLLASVPFPRPKTIVCQRRNERSTCSAGPIENYIDYHHRQRGSHIPHPPKKGGAGKKRVFDLWICVCRPFRRREGEDSRRPYTRIETTGRGIRTEESRERHD